jgi:phosphate-selective porin OprO/OprP
MKLARILLAGAAICVPQQVLAAAADSTATNAKIEALEQEIQDLSSQVQDLKRSTSSQYADAQNRDAQAVKVKLDNGRLTFSSGDGRFTAATRALAQYDWGYYMQGKGAFGFPAAYGPDLSSGANFRRVYLGIQGTLFGDWSYNLNFDFGGSSGTEAPGRIQSVYIEYDGLAPFAVRAGAFPPPSNLEDSTSAGDTIFLERNAPSDLQRNLAGGDGRDAVSLLYAGERIFGAISFSGDKVQETTPIFQEQQAFVGRLSGLVYSTADAHLLVGANGTYVIKPAGGLARNAIFPSTTLANGSAFATFAFSDPPELTVDANGLKLANTTSLSAKNISQWGLESAGNWGPVYGQGGYYSYEIDRAPESFTVFTASATSHAAVVQPLSDHFTGWYAQAAWTLTGEERAYNQATGAFTPPKPADPFSLSTGGLGALELAARYSDLNLNDRTADPTNVITGWAATSKTFTYFNTVRGGDQRILTGILNWYPNSAIKLTLQYQYVQLSRLQSGSTPSSLIVVGPTLAAPVLPSLSASQNYQTIALRAQVAL